MWESVGTPIGGTYSSGQTTWVIPDDNIIRRVLNCTDRAVNTFRDRQTLALKDKRLRAFGAGLRKHYETRN